MSKLKRFIYDQRTLHVLRVLGVTGALRSLHYKWATEADGVYRTQVCGMPVAFHANNPSELVQVEFNLMLEQDIFGWLRRYLRRGDTFMDIGANIGVFAVTAAALVGEDGQVIAFEPETCAFSKLQRNSSTNGLKNLRAFRVAVGDENTNGQLYTDRPAASLLAAGEDSRGSERSESVQIVSGDSFRETHGLPVPRVLKIDVEGFELKVLRGLRATLSHPAAELVLCEVHPCLLPADTPPEKIKEFLQSLGFSEILEFARRREVQIIASKRPLVDGEN